MLRRTLPWLLIPLFATPALAENVDTAWVRRYNGPGNGQDISLAIALDAKGNTYVTGSSLGAGTDLDYATIKYLPNGDTAWVRRYFAVAGPYSDEPADLAVDTLGNVYVTGGSKDPASDFDFATIKYSATGDVIWIRRYMSAGINVDAGATVAVDGNENVVVAGDTWGGYLTLKYTPDGDTAWGRTYSGGNGYDYGRAMALDGHGNIYSSGSSFFDYATVKYDSLGNQLWVRTYDGPGKGLDWVQGIAIDEEGNVYVTGYSYGDGTDYDFATIKYRSNGDTVWIRRYNGSGNGADWSNALAVAGSAVVVTGYSVGAEGNQDYTTIKYDSLGNEVWIRQYNGTGNGNDQAVAVVVDDSGAIYVAGSTYGSAMGYDYTTVKYDRDGSQKWVKCFQGPGADNDGARALAIDKSGSVYVTGWSTDTDSDADFTTIKYIQYLCGDANGDRTVNISDAVYLIAYIFAGGDPPNPLVAGDANGDGSVNISDAVYLIAYIFAGGHAPCTE